MNASPISDLNPVWIALGAKFKVMSEAKGVRVINAHQFFTAYKKVDLANDEVLVSVGKLFGVDYFNLIFF